MTRRARDVAGYSFVAQVNYVGALDRNSARVVSCNTTSVALTKVHHRLRAATDSAF